MAKKEKELIQSIEDFEKKLYKGRKRLIKAIDSEGKLSKDRIDSIAKSELIFDRRQWTLSKGKKVLSLISKSEYNSDEVLHDDDGKMLVIRGEEYTYIEVMQLGDCGYYALRYILDNEKEL